MKTKLIIGDNLDELINEWAETEIDGYRHVTTVAGRLTTTVLEKCKVKPKIIDIKYNVTVGIPKNGATEHNYYGATWVERSALILYE